jgi:hypothetical protein
LRRRLPGACGKFLASKGDGCRQNAGSRFQSRTPGNLNMGKGNNSKKNDKKNMKPKQDKTKPAAKK